MQDRRDIHGSLKTLIIAPTASPESFFHILYSDTFLLLPCEYNVAVYVLAK